VNEQEAQRRARLQEACCGDDEEHLERILLDLARHDRARESRELGEHLTPTKGQNDD
jgi:hypothetical protein